MTDLITQDARDERELLEGLRVLNRVATLCTELSLDTDTDHPHFVEMNTPFRFIGDPIPWLLPLAISGDRAYRVTGTRGTSTYLGMQVLAGTGLNPRRMSNYLSDHDLVLDEQGRFNLVFSAAKPAAAELAGAQWIQILTTRRRSWCATTSPIRQPPFRRSWRSSCSERGSPAAPLTDDLLADQLTAMGWTIVKMTTLHRTVLPDLVDNPNRLVTSEAQSLGGETPPRTTCTCSDCSTSDPDKACNWNSPPETRYWSVTLRTSGMSALEPLVRRAR